MQPFSLWHRSPRNTINAPATGFGGWLLLLAVGVYLSPLRTVVNLSKVEEGVDESVLQRFSLMFHGEICLNLILLLLQITTAVFMARKSRRFIDLFIWTGIYIVLVTPLDLLWVSAVISSQTDRSFGNAMELVSTPETLGSWIGVSIPVAVWMLYVTRSRRVANTFTR
jgi:hypothetical protein